MKRLENHTLAIGVASILILAASGVATPALTALAATSSNDNNNNNNNNKNDDKNNKDVLRFLIDVIQCFTNNDPHGSNGTNYNNDNHGSNNNNNNNDHHNKPFTHDVKQCLYDVIDKYFPNNNSNNNENNNNNNNKNNNNSNNNN